MELQLFGTSNAPFPVSTGFPAGVNAFSWRPEMLDRSPLIRSALFAVAGAMAVAATVPASAREGSKPAGSAETSMTSSQPDRKICLAMSPNGTESVTGSMLPKRECRTREQWEARGVKFQTK